MSNGWKETMYYAERVFNHKDFNAVCSYPFLEVSTKMFPEIQDFSVINYWKNKKPFDRWSFQL
jgi:putative ABC transport system permease protein